MRKIDLNGTVIFVACHRNIDGLKFNKVCGLIRLLGEKIYEVKKSSVILVHDEEVNYVIERMNTDTYTLFVHYEISRQKVYRISQNQTIS